MGESGTIGLNGSITIGTTAANGTVTSQTLIAPQWNPRKPPIVFEPAREPRNRAERRAMKRKR